MDGSNPVECNSATTNIFHWLFVMFLCFRCELYPINRNKRKDVSVIGFLKILTAILLLIMVVSACSEKTVEQQIESQIVAMQQAISDKSLKDFMTHFAHDFMGNKMVTRQQLKQQIFFHFRRNRNIETYKVRAEVLLEQETVRAKIFVIVSGSNNKLPERGRVYTINSTWEQRDNSWVIITADWKDAVIDSVGDIKNF